MARAFDVELEWGAGGVEALAGGVDHLVLVDVLSFTTCVDVALEQGASVLPWRWHNPTAEAYARERGARLAQRREAAGEGGLSLSPGSLRKPRHFTWSSVRPRYSRLPSAR